MSEDSLRRHLDAQIRNRALIYATTFDALSEEVGAAKAEAIMRRAIYNRGCQVADAFKAFAPSDMAGLRDAFLKAIPDEGRAFQPEIRRCDASGLDIKFHACPLKQAWVDAGIDDARLETLCRIAGIIDNGTFEEAGFSFAAETWKPGDTGCCFLHISPGPATARTPL
jgi:hypothetical protein